jgi:hypothetical protein
VDLKSTCQLREGLFSRSMARAAVTFIGSLHINWNTLDPIFTKNGLPNARIFCPEMR